MENQRVEILEFETGKSAEVYTKWQIELELIPIIKNYRAIFYLRELRGFPDGKVHSTAICTLLIDNKQNERECRRHKNTL